MTLVKCFFKLWQFFGFSLIYYRASFIDRLFLNFQRTLCQLTITQCFNDRPHFCSLNTAAATSIRQQQTRWCKTLPAQSTTLATMSSSIAAAATTTMYLVTSKRIRSYQIALLLPNWTYRPWTTAGRMAQTLTTAPTIRTDSSPRPFTWVFKRSVQLCFKFTFKQNKKKRQK